MIFSSTSTTFTFVLPTSLHQKCLGTTSWCTASLTRNPQNQTFSRIAYGLKNLIHCYGVGTWVLLSLTFILIYVATIEQHKQHNHFFRLHILFFYTPFDATFFVDECNASTAKVCSLHVLVIYTILIQNNKMITHHKHTQEPRPFYAFKYFTAKFRPIASPCKSRGIRIGPLHSLLVVPVVIAGDTARRHSRVEKDDLKGPTVPIHNNISHLYQHMFHTALALRLVYLFQRVFGPM